MVSAKAEKLLAVIQAKGGGILDEYLLRDKTGLSHGSIVAGRKELEMAGLLQLTKQGAMAEPPNSDPAAAFLPAMPHIAGTFYDFDEWTDALMNALGACIYISESLTGDGTYTVYSHEYEGEDTYLTETTEDGFIVQ